MPPDMQIGRIVSRFPGKCPRRRTRATGLGWHPFAVHVSFATRLLRAWHPHLRHQLGCRRCLCSGTKARYLRFALSACPTCPDQSASFIFFIYSYPRCRGSNLLETHLKQDSRASGSQQCRVRRMTQPADKVFEIFNQTFSPSIEL